MPGRILHIREYYLLLILIIGSLTAIYAQVPELSPRAKVSVITCGTGNELYSAFGHSAFRVQDPQLGLDLIYNYGTFDFDTPNFYGKFAMGKLLYSLSRERFENFLYTYQLENRWVKEQLLELNPGEEQQIFNFLENNYKPENRHYLYDFINENCSTKIPEVLAEVLGSSLEFTPIHEDNPKSFRDLIREFQATNSWSGFGIDLALGAVVDRKAQSEQYMFLPYYVFEQLENTKYMTTPILERERTILDIKNNGNEPYFNISPGFWLGLLMVFTITITLIDYKNGSRSRWLDAFLFALTGVTGLVLVFLWFFTDHTATLYNLNVLWAFPFNIILAFFLIQKREQPQWIQKYLLITLILLILVLPIWLTGIQKFSPLISLILLFLGVRYAYVYYYLKIAYPRWHSKITNQKKRRS